MIKYRKAEWEMVERYNVRMFTLGRGNFTGEEMARIFIKAISKIAKFVFNNPPPYIVKINRFGKFKRIL